MSALIVAGMAALLALTAGIAIGAALAPRIVERRRRAAAEHAGLTVSQMLQRHLPTSKVAKGFNHIMASDITTAGLPAGTPGRRALATASDHADAAQFVTDLYDAFGFDTVNVGPLAESWRVERDQPAYVVPQDRDELVANLARAERRLAA